MKDSIKESSRRSTFVMTWETYRSDQVAVRKNGVIEIRRKRVFIISRKITTKSQ